MNKEKRKMSSKTRIRLLILLLGVCIVTMAVFGIGLILEIRTTSQGQSFYSAAPVQYRPRQPVPSQSPDTVTQPKEQPEQSAGDDDSEAQPDEPVHVPFMDFDEARSGFPDLVAWIQSAGTVINYPVVRGTDNDYYLSHLPDLSSNKMGSVFLDYRNAPDFSDQCILIYGHNMKSEDIFGSLKNYLDQSYFDQHDSMYLFTPDADYMLVIIAGYILDSAYEIPPMSFGDSGSFENYISDVQNRSVFKSGAGIEYGDQIVFLCTCATRGVKSERFVLACKLVKV